MKTDLLFKQLFTFLISGLILFSCDKDICDTCNESPLIDKQEFFINENSIKGTAIDTVKAFDNDLNQKLSFKIIGGNTNDVFEINERTGILYVNNSTYLDYEKNPAFQLTIEVTDNHIKPLSATNSITINLIDIQPTQVGLVSFFDFQGDIVDSISGKSGYGNNIEYNLKANNSSDEYLFLRGEFNLVQLPYAYDFSEKTINLWFNVISAKRDELGVIYSSDSPYHFYGLTVLNTLRVDSHIDLYYNVSGQQDTIEVETNKWYNATIVTQNKTYAYYLNGELINSGAFNNYLSSDMGNYTATIGCDRTISKRFFCGFIDNLRIYNRKLEEDEIKTLYFE